MYLWYFLAWLKVWNSKQTHMKRTMYIEFALSLAILYFNIYLYLLDLVVVFGPLHRGGHLQIQWGPSARRTQLFGCCRSASGRRF